MIPKISKIGVALPIVAMLLCLSASEPSFAAENKKADEIRSYKTQMIECFNTGKFEWCSEYAKRIVSESEDSSDKALAEYYNANSLVKLGKLPDARAAYIRAKAGATDPTIIKNCDQAIASIRESGMPMDTRVILYRAPARKTIDNSVDALLARERDQLAGAGGANGMDYRGFKDVESFLPQYKQYMSTIDGLQGRLRDLNAQKQTPDVITEEGIVTRSIDYWKKQIDQSTQYNPAFKALLLKLDQFQSQEKQALSQRDSNSLNTEPKLQVVGSDLYTKNYASAAAQSAPKAGDPNELMATEERMVLDAHSVPGKTISRIVKVPNETKPSNADLKVHGNLLP